MPVEVVHSQFAIKIQTCGQRLALLGIERERHLLASLIRADEGRPAALGLA